jgi:putative ABC transport system substrate-binding protein
MRRQMLKRLSAVALAVVMTVSLTACGGETQEADNADKTYKVGVLQLVEHPALDASNQGFCDVLEEAGITVEIDQQNAQGEQANCQTIASKFVTDQKDLILAIATPAAQACASETTEIPVLVTAVTDPADAQLVESNELPGGNVSGTSDLTPVADQLKLLQEILPDTKKVGILYCSSESNSVFQANLAKDAAAELGMETIEATVSNSNEIEQVTRDLCGKVDAIYAPTDNMIAAGMATVAMVANELKVPVIVGEEGMCDNGGLATQSISYYELGRKTGEQAVKILKGEATTAEMPIEYVPGDIVTVNEDTAKELGITIPQSVLDKVQK